MQDAPAALQRGAILFQIGAHARHRLMPASPVDLDRDLEPREREIEPPFAIGVKPEFRLREHRQGLQDAPGALERYFGGRSRGAGSNPAARIAASSSGLSSNP